MCEMRHLVARESARPPRRTDAALADARGGLEVRLGRRERERLAAPLLAEHERQLLRWPQPVRVCRAEGRAGLLLLQRAEAVRPEEAVLTARLLRSPGR